MEITNTFEVPVAAPEAWTLLLDIERVITCLPGAELTETVDEQTYKGKFSVRLGPVALVFAGNVRFEERDEANLTAFIKGQATDTRGRGGANSDIRLKLVPKDGATEVEVHTDVRLSGAVAQYGRGAGMVADLANRIIDQFAECLREQLVAASETDADQSEATVAPESPDSSGVSETSSPTPPPQPAPPVELTGMGLKVLWAAILRAIGRLFGRSS